MIVPVSGIRFGVALPEVEAGVPVMGRRLEMMPVVVRRRGSVHEEGSWWMTVSTGARAAMKIEYLGVIDLVVTRYSDLDRL